MRYLITLKPLEPFLFGGATTFGQIGDEANSSYLVHSRLYPQQTALLGMLRKELMTQAGVLTRKVRGEWVDPGKKAKAVELVGAEKFDMQRENRQNLGQIKEISPVFLLKGEEAYIPKADLDKHPYDRESQVLKGYSPKNDIFDNFVSLQTDAKLKQEDIFKPVEQIGIKKRGGDDAFFKKTSYLLEDRFTFAFYLDTDFPLQNSIVTLGADRSAFSMHVAPAENILQYATPKDQLVLLSDAYITLPLHEHCTFAITREISHQNLRNKKHVSQKNKFEKSNRIYLYEKGSVIIDPSDALVQHLNNPNLQQIGYNIHTRQGATQ